MLRHRSSLAGRIAALTLAAVLFAGLLAACGKNEDDAKVVAEYEGGQIANGEFEAYKTFLKIFYYASFPTIVDEPTYQEEILKQLIGIRILSDRATDDVKKQSETDAKEQFDQIKSELDANEDVKKTMEDGGLTEDKLLQFMTEQVTMLNQGVADVSDETAQTYYDENKDSYNYASVRHILIGLTDKNNNTRTDEEALKLANEIKGKLEAGGDWTELAAEYSDDGGSASNGGLYEKYDPNQWVEEFKNAALTLEINEISDPVKTSYGYHVMKVEDRGTKTFDEVKAEIKQTLASEEVSKFMTDELPGLITSTDLPEPPASESPSASPSASASSTPGASAPATESPAASPDASASPSASAAE
ncbi:peptidylprolyl isomerase [Cohnella massiliensis]|uniref:peptidylprolyl isomerase n=1 Tax=Cohnella massiliensis TaxID=1816691 RepID=UPI0015938C01|nr:peptidylprolyl isomerase [Cohnella massiliensis]